MADFLDTKRREIKGRLSELQPYVDEYRQLEQAAAALESVGGASVSTTRARRSTRRATSTRTSTRRSGRRPGRRRGTGTRAAQALELVRAQPGITIPELAGKMGIKQNYLYRVLPGLEQDGSVEKRGRGWHAKAA